jgi:SAM-dependent methyltransferase
VSKGLYVQYGCHHVAPAGWENFDASPTLRFERTPVIGRLYNKNGARFPVNVAYGDIAKGLPLAAGSCRAIYCSHILEHLALSDFRRALRNTYDLLEAGGLFRLVMPDLESCARSYFDDAQAGASLTFMRVTGLGIEDRPKTPLRMLASLLGNSQHYWLWDFKSAREELVNAGFHDIRRAGFGDSAERRFAEVEEQVKWHNNLGIECTK